MGNIEFIPDPIGWEPVLPPRADGTIIIKKGETIEDGVKLIKELTKEDMSSLHTTYGKVFSTDNIREYLAKKNAPQTTQSQATQPPVVTAEEIQKSADIRTKLTGFNIDTIQLFQQSTSAATTVQVESKSKTTPVVQQAETPQTNNSINTISDIIKSELTLNQNTLISTDIPQGAVSTWQVKDNGGERNRYEYNGMRISDLKINNSSYQYSTQTIYYGNITLTTDKIGSFGLTLNLGKETQTVSHPTIQTIKQGNITRTNIFDENDNLIAYSMDEVISNDNKNNKSVHKLTKYDANGNFVSQEQYEETIWLTGSGFVTKSTLQSPLYTASASLYHYQ